MAQEHSGIGCKQICWGLGIVLGVLAIFILHGPIHWGWFGAIAGGIAVALLAGWILRYFFCGAEDTLAVRNAETSMPMPVGSAGPAAVVSAPEAKDVPAAEESVEEPNEEPQAEDTPEVVASVSAPVIEPAPEPAAKPKTAKPKPSKPKAPKNLPEVSEDAIAAAGAGKKPRGMKEPRKGQADDLKKIEGIGPALEKLCNDLGIYHFDQIAKWGPNEVAYMNQNLPRFRGRVSRDKWVSQARLIGEVGLEEFLERAKTNNY